jgi:hypothetical protein
VEDLKVNREMEMKPQLVSDQQRLLDIDEYLPSEIVL